MLNGESAVKVVEAFAQDLEKCGIWRLTGIFLIGSFATKTFGTLSDVDVLIVLNEVVKEDLEAIRDIASSPYVLDIKVISEAEYCCMPGRYRVALHDAVRIHGVLDFPPVDKRRVLFQIEERLYRLGARVRRIIIEGKRKPSYHSAEYLRDLLKRCLNYLQLKYVIQNGKVPPSIEAALACSEIPESGFTAFKYLSILRSGNEADCLLEKIVDLVQLIHSSEVKWLYCQRGVRKAGRTPLIPKIEEKGV